MNEIQTIQSKIYEIRGQRVMLDFDLASMYGVETRQEESVLTSQNAILKDKRGQHKKYMPYAFTEQGVAMLSSVLRSPLAIQKRREEQDSSVDKAGITPPYNHLEIKTLQVGAPNGVPVPFQASYAIAA